MFGMDAEDVPVWREGKRHEWSEYDPRFVKALELVKSGTFGDKEYFQVPLENLLCAQSCRLLLRARTQLFTWVTPDTPMALHATNMQRC